MVRMKPNGVFIFGKFVITKELMNLQKHLAPQILWQIAWPAGWIAASHQNPSEISKVIPIIHCYRTFPNFRFPIGLFIASIHRITFGLGQDGMKSAYERILSPTRIWRSRLKRIQYVFPWTSNCAWFKSPAPQIRHFHLLHLTQLGAPDHHVCQIDTRQTDHLDMTSNKPRKQRRKQQWSNEVKDPKIEIWLKQGQSWKPVWRSNFTVFFLHCDAHAFWGLRCVAWNVGLVKLHLAGGRPHVVQQGLWIPQRFIALNAVCKSNLSMYLYNLYTI